jgi:predicted nucleic acid-binding protein
MKVIVCDAGPLIHISEADWFLTDDATTRLFVSLLGLEVHGSLGIILWNAAKGYLGRDEAKSALNRLEATSLWLSDRIRREVYRPY